MGHSLHLEKSQNQGPAEVWRKTWTTRLKLQVREDLLQPIPEREEELSSHHPRQSSHHLQRRPFPKREPSEVPLSQLPTSKTHKRQWSCLDRVATGPRAKAHPSLTALWNGSSEDKRRALYQYLQNEENLAATEAAMQVTRRKTDSMTHSRRWMTLKQMHEEKFSECLARS